MPSDGPSWAQGLAIAAFLLFVLAVAVQYGYLSPNFVGGLTSAGLTVLGVIPLIGAIGLHLADSRRHESDSYGFRRR